MQIGRLEMMEQSQVDYVSKISKIQEADKKATVDPDEKYKNLQSSVQTNNNEMILDNVKFGYNSDTNEFFVRIKKGNQEYQYPTEDMFKLKKSLIQAYEDTLKK
jgi:hypothetical protein